MESARMKQFITRLASQKAFRSLKTEQPPDTYLLKVEQRKMLCGLALAEHQWSAVHPIADPEPASLLLLQFYLKLSPNLNQHNKSCFKVFFPHFATECFLLLTKSHLYEQPLTNITIYDSNDTNC